MMPANTSRSLYKKRDNNSLSKLGWIMGDYHFSNVFCYIVTTDFMGSWKDRQWSGYSETYTI
jgi:hypothetical protein